MKKTALAWALMGLLAAHSGLALAGAKSENDLRESMEARMALDLTKQGSVDGAELRAQVKRELDLRFALEKRAIQEGLDKTAQGKALARMAVQEALIRELMESERAKVVVSEDQLKADYALRYPSQKQVKARVALFKDEQKAKQEWAKVSSGAQTLEQAAKASDDETIAEKSGDLGFVALEALPEELAKAMGALKEGESLSGPVSTRFGYFIGKAEAFKEGPEQDFDSVKARLKEERLNIALKERLAALTEQALKSAEAKKP